VGGPVDVVDHRAMEKQRAEQAEKNMNTTTDTRESWKSSFAERPVASTRRYECNEINKKKNKT